MVKVAAIDMSDGKENVGPHHPVKIGVDLSLSPRPPRDTSSTQSSGIGNWSRRKERPAPTTREGDPSRSKSLTRLFSKGSNNSSKNKNKITYAQKGAGTDTGQSIVAEQEMLTEQDPVMALLQARNTNRVRFSVEIAEPNSKGRTLSRGPDSPSSRSSSFNIKTFVSKTMFCGRKKSASARDVDAEVLELESATTGGTMDPFIWTSAEISEYPNLIHTISSSKTSRPNLTTVSFTEDEQIKSEVANLLKKARIAKSKHFQYDYAVKCYVKALDLMKTAKYPDDHPTFLKALGDLNDAHHALGAFNNSANIAKMGLRYEESGELVKALKMYSVAYRIRRDSLSRSHRSLVILLNMLGGVQVKRGELKEAIQIYELALKDVTLSLSTDDDIEKDRPVGNLLARSITFREMGTIYEKWNDEAKALDMYHGSLHCVSEWRETKQMELTNSGEQTAKSSSYENAGSEPKDMCALDKLEVSKTFGATSEVNDRVEGGEMEVFFSFPGRKRSLDRTPMTSLYYSFFHKDEENKGRRDKSSEDRSDQSIMSTKSESTYSIVTSKAEERDTYADVDIAVTLHQIAQLYRRQRQYSMALDAYGAALRGMKQTLGKHHSNVAAILGNIGNLHKEMGDLDSAYSTYQEVLSHESNRLGLSHPEVARTIHNIATIEVSRGNLVHALKLYKKVLSLQKKLFGKGHISVAATTACMGDVYERRGDLEKAMEFGEIALQIRINESGKHNTEVGRTLHKLGKLAFLRNLNKLANSYTNRAILIYKLNQLDESNEWLVEALRDSADIQATLALGGGHAMFEC